MLIVQNRTVPGAIRNSVLSLIVDDVLELRVAVAYVTESGVKMLVEGLERAVGTQAFDLIPKTLVTCFDYGITAPQALLNWMALPNARLLISSPDVCDAAGFKTRSAFHPKLYIFDRVGSCNIHVGSANLTGAGWTQNTEAGWSSTGYSKQQADKDFQEVLSAARSVSATDIARYAARRDRAPPPSLPADASPVPEPPELAFVSLPVLKDVLASNVIELSGFDAMWVQVDNLQGGSGNQLELPRGAHRFFSLEFDGYETAGNSTIGIPALVSGRMRWDDRKLTWHGHNGMERINLPTRSMGGFSYDHSAVLFRRLRGGDFEIVVAPWDSDLARSWRTASSELGQVYLLGRRNTSRLFGTL